MPQQQRAEDDRGQQRPDGLVPPDQKKAGENAGQDGQTVGGHIQRPQGE